MSQSEQQIMDDQIHELIGEITFQRCLLESLGDTVKVGREETEAIIRDEIRSLEGQVKKLRRAAKMGTSASANSQVNQSVGTSVSPSTPRRQPLKGENVRGALDDILGQNQWASLDSSAASTPNTADSLADLPISPSRMDLPGRKRTHSTHLDGGLAPFGESKRRITPSPSFSSSEDEADFLDIQAEYHKKQAKLLEERMLQEKQDADLARALSQRPMPPPVPSGPSAFDRISGIRHPSTPTAYGTPNSSLSSQYSAHGNYPAPTIPSSVKVESAFKTPVFTSSQGGSRIKAEPSSSKSMPGQFRRGSDTSDSDIEIIPKSAFLHSTIGLAPKSEPKSEPAFYHTPGMSNMNSLKPPKSRITLSMPPMSNLGSCGTSSGSYVYPQATPSISSRPFGMGEIQAGNSVMLPGYSNMNVQNPLPGLGYAVNTGILPGYANVNVQNPQPGLGFANAGRPLGHSGVNVHNSQQGFGYVFNAGISLGNSNVGVQTPQQGLGYAVNAGIPPSYSNAGIQNRQPGHVYAVNTGFPLGYSNVNVQNPQPILGSVVRPGGLPPRQNNANVHIPQLGLSTANVQRPTQYFGSATGLHRLGASAAPLNGPFNNTTPAGTIIGQPYDLSDSDMDMDYLLSNPGHAMNHPAVPTSDDLKNLLDNIKPEGDDVPPEARDQTPDGMKYPLYEHQKIALTWLKAMETGSNKGGILADDMGLGKTISALALILSRPSTDRARKTTLILGPVSLVRQWEQEIRNKIRRSHRLSTHMMHGQKSRKLTWSEVQGFDIVLTTYGTLAHEFKSMQKWIAAQQAEHGGSYDQAPMAAKFPLLGPKSLFYRVILDEAHSIKNKATGAAKAACSLKSIYRLSLSGTPMQNNPNELYSQIHFLRIRPYNEWTRWQSEFGCLTKYDKNKSSATVSSAMRKLQAVLKAILLRRTKSGLIDGKPIINLPPKTEEIQHVIFNDDEQAYYKALETKTQLVFNRYLKAGTVGKNYSNILVLLLRLRQACCHPHLIMDFEEAPPAGSDMNENKMIELAKTLSPEVVSRLLETEAFECPVCYDANDDPRIIVPCGHDTCSECLTKICDQAAQSHANAGNEGNAACKCPSCRGELRIDKIIDLRTFNIVHKSQEIERLPVPNAASVPDDSETESDTDSDSDQSDIEEDEDDSGDDLRDFIVPDDMEEDEIEDGDDEAEAPTERAKPRSKAKPKAKLRRREKGKGKEKEKVAHTSLAMLKKESTRSLEHKRKYFRYLRKNYQPSAKVDKCVELLERFQADGQKTIVFSQFTTLLDLVEVPLQAKKIKLLRYDGSMSGDARADAINVFTESHDKNIMLVSLKAGNAGLNLVAASRVIILDPFWNPYIEMQAIDRAHRIGQQKPVEVHRILVAGSVEDRILELQEKKRALVDAALDEGASKALARLGATQLAFLFGVSNLV